MTPEEYEKRMKRLEAWAKRYDNKWKTEFVAYKPGPYYYFFMVYLVVSTVINLVLTFYQFAWLYFLIAVATHFLYIVRGKLREADNCILVNTYIVNQSAREITSLSTANTYLRIQIEDLRRSKS